MLCKSHDALIIKIIIINNNTDNNYTLHTCFRIKHLSELFEHFWLQSNINLCISY